VRGRYRILLGMAAGVGKTYRMLQEGRQAKAEGRDVVIGYLEPHDRPDTSELADGIEVVPRLRSEMGGLELEEMDVDAVIARHPDLALIDELAHTNARGMRNEKRYQDIEEVIAAGIDVISTVNIQHLESLNDAVSELTGSACARRSRITCSTRPTRWCSSI
jgi:two-component system sensor histidine kinase KdpD